MKEVNGKLREYLLGSLTKVDDEAISLQIIEDQAFDEEIAVAENALIEDFLEKNLTPAEEKLFCENFLINEERKANLNQLSLLKNYARAQNAFEIRQTTEERESFISNIKVFFSKIPRPVMAVFALLLVCLALGLTWRFYYFLQGAPSRLEQEYALLNSKDLSNSAEPAIILSLDSLRGAGAVKKIATGSLTENSLFRLPLPFQISDTEFLKLEVLNDQKIIFTQNQVRIYKNPNGQEVKFLLPKSILEKGNYQIKLENPNSKDAPINCFFAVE